MLRENKQKVVKISDENLPLCCPMPDMQTWNSHPRVFLKIEKEPSKEITCPYCSTHYVLSK